MRKAATLLLWLGVGACATAPAYRPPAVQVPPAFRETTRDRASSGGVPRVGAAAATPAGPAPAAAGFEADGFWQGLGDTTFSRLVSQALRANLDLPAAQARVRGAPARAGGAPLRRSRSRARGRSARPRAARHLRGELPPPAALCRDVPDRSGRVP